MKSFAAIVACFAFLPFDEVSPILPSPAKAAYAAAVEL